MAEEDNPANIEWGQKDFADKPRQSRKINLQKAMAADAKDRNNFKSKIRPPKDLPKNLKKIRTKIKEVYDEDDDEEENEVVFSFSLEETNSSLINALKDEEKSKLMFNKTLENQKMQQTAGKMEAILMADQMSKKLGLSGLKKKVVRDNIQDVALNSETFDKTIKQNIAVKTKLKTEDLSAKETSDMVKGLKKMKQAAAVSEQIDTTVTETLKAQDLIKIGKSQDVKKTAEMILEKSGRKESKKQSKKTKESENQKIKSAIKQTKSR